MAISVSCGDCGRDYNVKDDAAGKKFKCKDCGAVIQVPEGMGADDDFGDLSGDLEDDWGDAGGDPLPAPSGGPKRKKRRKSRGGRSVQAAKDRIKGPAITLLVMCGLTIALRLLAIALNFAGFAMAPQPQPGQPELDPNIQMALGVGVNAVVLLVNIFTMYGLFELLNVRSYGIALTAAILSSTCICSPCGCFGFPFGIWALVVMNDVDVKRAFQ